MANKAGERRGLDGVAARAGIRGGPTGVADRDGEGRALADVAVRGWEERERGGRASGDVSRFGLLRSIVSDYMVIKTSPAQPNAGNEFAKGMYNGVILGGQCRINVVVEGKEIIKTKA